MLLKALESIKLKVVYAELVVLLMHPMMILNASLIDRILFSLILGVLRVGNKLRLGKEVEAGSPELINVFIRGEGQQLFQLVWL